MKPGDSAGSRAVPGIMNPFTLTTGGPSLFDKARGSGGGSPATGLDDLFSGHNSLQLGTGPGVINPDFSIM